MQLGSDGDEDSGDRRTGAGAAQGVDEGPFGRALARWAPLVERYLRRRAHRAVLARESAADLAQSVCREALERLQRGDLSFRGERELKQWLFGAADLKVRNRLRFYGAARRAGGSAVDAAGVAQDPGPSPSADAARIEARAAFERALAALDGRQRAAVRMFHLEGRGHAEVAAALGITESHSRTLVARALARLARLVREDEGAHGG